MAKNIRSNYIKNLMEDKEDLDKTLRESTKDILKDIIDESINKNLRSMISEADEDDYDEEEVTTDNELETASTDTKDGEEGDKESTDDSADDSNPDVAGGEDEFSEPDVAGGEDEFSEPDEDEVWDSLEQYKDNDGEYDLTGMGSDDVVKVLQVMKPEDGIRVVKNSDGNITLTDDNNDTEYIIQLEGDVEPEEDSYEYEVTVDDDVDEAYSRINEYDSHVGYTDNYQKQTAMTTPPNNEPADPKTTYSMDDGVPKGTEKPWAGKGDDSPFNHKVNEGEGCEDGMCECDAQLTEDSGEFGLADEHSSVSKTHSPKTAHTPARNSSVAGVKHKGTADNAYSPNEPNSALGEDVIKKANQIFNENKQLKEIAGQIKERLSEACTINASLGKIIKLVTENTTTREEKIDIVNRFNDVKSIGEANSLYETISRELQNAHPINNVSNVMSGQQLAEGKQHNVVETSMYQSDDLAKTRDLMERVINLGKNN